MLKFWAAYRIKLRRFMWGVCNVSVWVWHVSQLVWSICTTRIMSWWVNPCVPVKVVISTSSSEERSATGKTHRFWYRSSALIRNLLHQFTRKWPLLLCHYTTRTFLACDPVVDVALDQEFLANAAPRSLASLADQDGRGVTAFRPVQKLE